MPLLHTLATAWLLVGWWQSATHDVVAEKRQAMPSLLGQLLSRVRSSDIVVVASRLLLLWLPQVVGYACSSSDHVVVEREPRSDYPSFCNQRASQ